MRIKRFTNEPFGSFVQCDGGEFVFHTDYLADKHAALDAQKSAHAAEVERLTADRDAAVRERDEACEALKMVIKITEDQKQYTCCHVREVARAALDKIGGRNA